MIQPSNSEARVVFERYVTASGVHMEKSTRKPTEWHRPDVAEFRELQRLLLPHAESGDVLCQYAVATILWLGLCCESEAEYEDGHEDAKENATPWWEAAAAKGYWPALDNLVTDGVGAEAQRARDGWKQLEKERPDLVGWSGRMPIYGPDIVQELSRRLYGRVIDASA